jgi:pimeloyl-ACP methyl ester carboxylesterase
MEAGCEASVARHVARRSERRQPVPRAEQPRDSGRATRIPGRDADGLSTAAAAILRQPISDREAESGSTRVTKEYGVDTSRIYLHGQNPSGSGALYLGAKYPERFAALVISSGPIVFDSYPWDRIKGKMGLLVIHGDQDTTNPIEASKKMADAAKAAGVTTVYATVPGGTHLAAYLTYAKEIFDFLDTQRKQ